MEEFEKLVAQSFQSDLMPAESQSEGGQPQVGDAESRLSDVESSKTA